MDTILTPYNLGLCRWQLLNFVKHLSRIVSGFGAYAIIIGAILQSDVNYRTPVNAIA